MADVELVSGRVVPSEPQVAYYDLYGTSIKNLVKNDPVFAALNSKWPDKQHISRIAYESMLEHGAVSGPMNSLFGFLASQKPLFKAQNSDPTDRQQRFVQFLNDQLARLGASGDPRQGYAKVIEWLCGGLVYGFTLAQMATTSENWRGKPAIQVSRILPVAQSTLDNGFVPRQEYGEGILSNWDSRYKCFGLDPYGGAITKIVQFSGQTNEVVFEGPDLLHILHYVHRGGQGNPYGESMLYSAFRHWASLYTIEAMEEAFLDSGLPYLTFSYKTPDGRPSPALHSAVMGTIKSQDPSLRAFVMPDTTFGSVAPSNPNFTDHVFRRKSELRSYIGDAIHGHAPASAEAGAGQQSNIRELVQVFSKNMVPAILREFSDVLTWQFGKRLIDANWTNVNTDDYPVLTFTAVQSDELRVALPLIQMLLPYVDSARLGEMSQSLVSGFDSAWIPKSHAQSVAMQRETPDPDTNQRAGESPATPSGKSPGTPDGNVHGQTGGAPS